MSDRFLEILGESCGERFWIPTGRQLPRTPPLMDVNRRLDFEDYDIMEPAAGDCSRPGTEADDPLSMLRGMKGYVLTPSDWEFIQQMKEEKPLQRDLKQEEVMAAELVCASRGKAQAELKKLTEWVKVVLRMASPSTKLTDLDTKSLLAMVTEDNFRRIIDEKRAELSQMVADMNKVAKERQQLERQIASQQIQRLMQKSSDLKSELTQVQEALQDLQMQIKAPMEAEKVDSSEELQATKSPRQGKQRKRAVKSTVNLEDTATNKSKSTRSKLTDSKTHNQTREKGETLKAKQKSGAAAEKPTNPAKAARGSKNKVDEKKSDPQESEQAVRGRRKVAATAQTTASQPKNSQRQIKIGQKAAVAAEEAQHAGLRRSKRIASRR